MTRIYTWPHNAKTGCYSTEPHRPLDDKTGPTGAEFIGMDVHRAALAAMRDKCARIAARSFPGRAIPELIAERIRAIPAEASPEGDGK